MVHPEIVHLELGPQFRSDPHPHLVPLPRSLTIRRDDIKRLAGMVVVVRIRSFETFDDDVSLVRDQRRDKYLRLLRKQRRHPVERGIRNLV